MDYFPGFLKLEGRNCLLVGGGDVALRKARLLHGAGARVIVVAPETSPSLGEFVERHALEYRQRRFAEDDVQGAWLVVSATGDDAADAAVYAAASRQQVFCNSVDNQAHSSYITPAIVDRSPLVVAISSGGAAPVLARTVREKIEKLLPADFGRLADLAGRWRDRVKAEVSDIRHRRRFWETLFGSDVPGLAIGGQYDRAEQRAAQLLLDFAGAERRHGKAWLIGAGPGDPDLLTVRALRILQTADVIVHDRLVSKEVLALARRDADLVSVGKVPGSRKNSQEDINALLVELVRAGKDVCRLKGGDPFVFARGGEELEALHDAGFRAEVVPGITAAAGCAAYAGIPLTHRNASQSVVFAAAHGKESVDTLDWPSLARDRQTLVFYMAVGRFPLLMNRLIDHGRTPDTPIAIVEKGTMPQQRVVHGRLGQLQLLAEARQIEPPAILIVGEVAALGARFAGESEADVTVDETQGQAICAKQG